MDDAVRGELLARTFLFPLSVASPFAYGSSVLRASTPPARGEYQVVLPRYVTLLFVGVVVSGTEYISIMELDE